MYLVLTALLALNVSREILHAFLVVNESMESTNEKFFTKIEATYAEFAEQNLINESKVRPYYNRAMQVKEYTKDFVSYVDSLKYTIIALTEGITIDEAKIIPLSEVKKKDNYDRPTNFFIGGTEKKGEAYTIREKIDKYRQDLIGMVDEEDRENFDEKLGLRTDAEYRNADGDPEPWERHHFYHTILAADITILNKFIAEAYNAELDVVNYLYSSISAEDFKFNEIKAKVIPNSNYIFQGDEYEAEILVAAYDTTQNPEIFILEGADTLTSSNLGMAKKIEGSKVILPASSEGTRKYAGIVKIKTPLGETKNYHFKHSFLVAKPTATVSATKMNVFYRGVDNPIAISASGKSDAQLEPSITVGRLAKVDQGWVVRDLPGEAIETTVKVYADDNGGKKFMGEHLFRIKRLPDPIAKVLGTVEEKITKSKMLANPFIVCQMPEWVEFEYDFKVLSFTMTIPQGGGYVITEKSDSQMFTQRMKDQIQNLKRNDILVISDIRVMGPEGSRKIESINVTID